MGPGPWDIYSDDQNPAPAYMQAAQSLVGDNHPTEAHFDTSIPQFGEPVDGWPEPQRSPDSVARAPADLVLDDYSMTPTMRNIDMASARAHGRPDYFSESLDPDNRMGERLGKERYEATGKNPWDFPAAMTDYSRDLSLDPEDLPSQRPYIRNIEVQPNGGPSRAKTGLFGTTQFLPDDAATNAGVLTDGPLTTDQAYIKMAPDLTPPAQLLTGRHELEHVHEFDQSMHQRGPGGLDPLTGLESRHGSKGHFMQGSQEDVEDSFLKHPYLAR